MSNIKTMMISRYDESIKEPPYLTVPVDTMTIEKPENDHLGEDFCQRIRNGCRVKGYEFKFYTLSETTEFDYEVVVK